MIEKIIYKKKLLALIVRGRYRNKKGITFFTPRESTQQFGYMKHEKKYIIKPHLHKPRKNKISTTSEVIILFKGVLRVDFYDYKEKYLMSKKIFANDIIMLVNGAHGFKVLKSVEMLEVKQGPYNINQDKFKFEKVDENKITLK